MANSKLATWKWSGKTDHYNTRDHKIDKITIHHQAGNLTPEQAAQATQSRGGSWNYCITSGGKIGVMIDEKHRAWTSSDRENDMRAVTIEVANDQIGGNWHVSDKALAALIDLCTDICKRNGIKRLNYTGDKTGNLTMHKWFAATACPGPYLSGKFSYIAAEVNKRLVTGTSAKPSAAFKAYKVKITYKGGMNVRAGAGVSCTLVKGVTAKYNTVYTIVAEKTVSGQVWGKLKSGAGWICLTGFTKKV